MIAAWSSPDALARCNDLQEQQDKEEFEPQVTVTPDEMMGNMPRVDPNSPSALWNGMINPLLPLGLKGATWYQGESDIGNPPLYACRFSAMIQDWREKFRQPQLSFYFVQLAPYNAGGGLPAIRDAQTAALQLPYVGMATAIDLWDPFSTQGEIHPRNKQTVGLRLSLQSQALDYKLNVDPFGPIYDRGEVLDTSSGWQVTLYFKASLGVDHLL